ncbi:hypothetical protein HYDPIDRAFT_107063 [Hydnomerulius pinastri MD-312]|nr:hypothetical protein HYDPIDRAFT_107063 [Hydnomerulius pinastri MD-312]
MKDNSVREWTDDGRRVHTSKQPQETKRRLAILERARHLSAGVTSKVGRLECSAIQEGTFARYQGIPRTDRQSEMSRSTLFDI